MVAGLLGPPGRAGGHDQPDPTGARRGLRPVSAPGGAGATGRGCGSAERGRLILALGAGRDASEFARLGSSLPSVRYRQTAIEETRRSCAASGVRRRLHSRVAVFRRSMRRYAPSPAQLPVPPVLIAGGDGVHAEVRST